MSCTHYVSSKKDMAVLLERRDQISDTDLWSRRYEPGAHFATPVEAREYLDLCLELGESFGCPWYMAASQFARYPMFASHQVAALMEKAGLAIPENDEKRLYAPEQYLKGVGLDVMGVLNHPDLLEDSAAQRSLMAKYSAVNEIVAGMFDAPYLRRAPRIVAAIALVEDLLRYWRPMEAMAWSTHRMERLEQVRKRLPWWDFGQRYRVSRMRMKQDLLKCAYSAKMSTWERGLKEQMECCYGGNSGVREFPLVSLRFVGDGQCLTMEKAGEWEYVKTTWHESELRRGLGDDKLTRLLELHGYVMTTIEVRLQQEMSKGWYGTIDLMQIMEHYPELPEDLYPYCMCTSLELTEGGHISVLRKGRRDEIRRKAGLKV